ncbi:unnamed protein product [Tetraodon nigroviridis]|uniref:(spotted green pufferfish) hypothetical protein n=1 Tax=Tetraodon nigroviridis TaxID=99883 RepID=Q4SZS1_TETNG|nr:unnamed protein product [Tetraodon nigroviridis]
MVGLPGAVSLPQCVSACCDLPGSDLAWLFQGRCYALSCRQAARCRPRGRPGADSVLVFLRRASPQTLVLQSLTQAPTTPDFSHRLLEVLQPSHGGPPASTRPPGGLTSDPSTLRSSSSPPTSPSKPEVMGSTRGPLAIVGPDRRLPPCRLLSLADCCLSGLSGLDGAERPVATATGLQAGEHRLRDQQGATDGALLSLQVWLKHQPAQPPSAVTVETAPPPPADPGPPPVAHASGSHTLTLPNNSLVLRGSVTGGDQTEVRYLWLRDRQSPAAGDVLYASDSQPSLYLSNLVQGTYLFQLQVTDARGRCSSAAATVEVRPEPGGGQEVELELLVPVWQVSVAQRDTLVRQLAALLHVLDAELQLRALQGRSPSSTVLRFSVAGPDGPTSASRLVLLLRNQLLGQKNDFLLFRVLRVEAVCEFLLEGAGLGTPSCDGGPVSFQPVRSAVLGGASVIRSADSAAASPSGRRTCFAVTLATARATAVGEELVGGAGGGVEVLRVVGSLPEWRLLYVILSSFMVALLILTISWTFICCCRRRQSKGRRRTRYTMLDNMDEQERVELRPRFCKSRPVSAPCWSSVLTRPHASSRVLRCQTSQLGAQLQPDAVRVRAGQRPGPAARTRAQPEPGLGRQHCQHLRLIGTAT